MKSAAVVAASCGVEGHDDGAVEPARRQQAQPVALAGELEQRVLRPQEKPRMRRESERRGLAAERLGARKRGADHRAVAAMHAVEIADRHHGAVQRPDIGRKSVLCAPLRAMWKALDLLIFASCSAAAFRATVTVSARLINFQINRIFNAAGYLPHLLGEARCGHSTMAVDVSIPILIVDDYNTMIRIIRNLLRQLGFEHIDEANDGTIGARQDAHAPIRPGDLRLEHGADDRLRPVAGSAQRSRAWRRRRSSW